MKHLYKQIISYFLLLCIAVTIIPLTPTQGYEDNSQCDLTNLAIENNPCHISCYHANDLTKKRCNHNAHFIKERTEFKNYIRLQREPYLFTKCYNIVTFFYSTELGSLEIFILPVTQFKAFLGRAPPV